MIPSMLVGVEPVAKAFDSERQRQRRKGVYEGGAAGGAVAAGIGANHRLGRAVALREDSRVRGMEAREQLDRAGRRTARLGGTKPLTGAVAQRQADTATRHIHQAGEKLTEAERLARKAAWSSRQGKLAAAGAAGLAGTAYALHRSGN